MHILGRFFFIILALTLALPGVAYAVCASPSGTAGEIRFDLSDRAVEYCDGGNWISLPKSNASTCSGPSPWTTTAITSNTWVSVAYGAGRFVALANSGANRLHTSTDGAYWSNTGAPVTATWTKVIYANGKFVAISNGDQVMVSTNGTSWSNYTVPEANNWSGITYGNGYYVAVARTGTNRVMRSTDGITWTVHPAAQANLWMDVAYGNGLFIAVTTAGTNQIMTSTDGATWAVGTIPAKSWVSIAFGNGLFVAASLDSPNNIATSTDGTSWSSSTPVGRAWNHVSFHDNMFIAVADNNTATNSVMTSTNGTSWTAANMPQNNNWTSAAIGNGVLVAVANIGTNRAATSRCSSGVSYSWGTNIPQPYIPHPTGNWWDNFGTSTATDGLYVVTGLPGSDIDINAGGLVYVLDAASGSVIHTIHNPAPGDSDNFGYANAIDGNLFVSSAVYSDIGATDTGRVYVFNTTTGALDTTLINPDVTADDNFGASVAISTSANRVAVGAPYNDNGATNAGSVYIFNASTGSLVTTIHNPAPAADDNFGSAVDIDGGYVVVGAKNDDPGAVTDAGSVYVFNISTGALVSTWANPAPATNDKFGTSVAIDGNIAVAGAEVYNAVVAYSFNAATGANMATFNNPDAGNTQFGYAVDIDGQFVTIGAQRNDTSGTGAGAVFIYNAYTGALLNSLYNTRLDNGDEFLGCSVSIKNGIIAAGACGDDIGDGDGNSGSVHIFPSRSSCSTPTGLAGEMRYNADHRVVQWCDGTKWHAAGPVDPSGPTGGCSTPTATAGYVMFSSNSCSLQYCDGGTWQAMGKSVSCACKPNAGSWTTQTPAAPNPWSSITYGNGLFVAVTGSGVQRVMTSPDGITWTGRTAAEGNAWNSVTYGNGLYVAVAGNGTNRVMTSPDSITWTARAAAEANIFTSVTYGNGLYVAVAATGTNRVMTSPDGITWTARAAAEANSWQSVTYGNGLFVAVAAGGTNRVMTSPDGTTWTARAAAQANTWLSITYGNGIFVAVSSDGTNRVMTSPDGITWTARTAAEPNAFRSVTYGNGRFVAVSSDGTNRVMTSPDGITWTAQPAAAANFWTSVAYGNGVFTAIASAAVMRIECLGGL